MIDFLIYLLKSTASLGIFYLLFRLLMSRETNFGLGRGLLLALVVASVIVPLVHLPQMIQSPVRVELIPDFSENRIQLQNISEAVPLTQPEKSLTTEELTSESNLLDFSLSDFLMVLYCTGVLLSLLMLVKGIVSVLLIFRSASFRQMPGYRLYINEKETPSFAFGRSVVISRNDYEQHGDAILAHEQAHIRLNHFYDLILIELVRAFHWFNPAAHSLVRDLKEIHEFQADAETLQSGVNVTHYQLLIIQKGVGRRRFALANSFNHCQIKKRIIMMNKSKTSKAWRWKVATFLPLLALLLMAFGKPGENVPMERMFEPPMLSISTADSIRNWEVADFNVFYKKDQEKIFFENKVLAMIQIDANSNVSIDDNKVSLDELSSRVKKWFDYKFADQEEWVHFQKITVNGTKKMSSLAVLAIRKDPSAKQADFLKLLNVVANTILQIRGDYSQEIFGNNYQRITATQRKEIDKLIPMNVVITDAILKKFEIAPPPPPPPAKKEKVNTLPPPPPSVWNEKAKTSLPPPPPPPKVIDISILISITEDAYSVKQKVCTFDEIEKMVNDINPKKEFVQIATRSTSSKDLQSSLKELLEKKGISYQISWTK